MDELLITGGATASEIRSILTSLGIDTIDNIIHELLSFDSEDEEGETITTSVSDELHTISEAVTTPRTFLDTPIDEYTVVEGLLLVIVLILFLQSLGRIIRGAFSWL